MENKRVLIVIPDIQLGGGAQRIAAEVGSNLDERGHEVTFLTVYDDETKYDYEGGYTTLDRERSPLPLSFSFNALRFARKISKVCKRKEIDTVISFMMLGNLGAVLSKVAFRNKAKIVVSVRNNPMKSDKKSRWQKKMLYRKADKVVALSEGVEHILRTEFSLDNTTYIHNIQNVAKFEKLADREIDENHLDIFDEGFVFITIGSLTRQKGHWYLLRCFKRATREVKDVKLVVLGDGVLRKKLDSLANDLDIEERVFLLGTVENVFPYLRGSDSFVFSSLWEGFGNVLTEALSQDLPVISTDCIAGPREILCPELEMEEEVDYPYHGRYGVLTETFEDRMFFKTLEEKPMSEEEEMFAETMIEIRKDDELRGRYSRGSDRVEDFSIEKIILEWEEII